MVVTSGMCSSVWSLVGKGREKASRGSDVTTLGETRTCLMLSFCQNWSLVDFLKDVAILHYVLPLVLWSLMSCV